MTAEHSTEHASDQISQLSTPVTLADEEMAKKAAVDRVDQAEIIDDEKPSPFGDPPDGGRDAWLALTGCGIAFFMSFGMVTGFGVFQEHYVTRLLKGKSISSEANVSWIGSTQTFFTYSGGILFGALYDKYGVQKLMFCGAAGYVISCMLISLCHEWWQLFLTQALMLGISISCLFTPPLSVLTQWFMKRRGMAMGAAAAGSSLGSVVWPIAIRNLLDTLGFGWTLRIVGFIGLFLLTIASCITKNRIPPDGASKNLFNFSAFKHPGYTFLVTAQCLNFFGFFFLLFYLPLMGTKFGLSTSMASYALSILSAASFFGRILPGIIADYLGRFNILLFAAVSSGITTLSALAVNNGPGVIIIAAFYGFFSGSIISVQGACVPMVSRDPRLIGTNMGMIMGGIAIPSLLGSPIAGWLVEYRHGSYDSAFIFAGVMLLAGSCFLLASKMTLNKNIFKII